jgi:hypothetical protein
VLLFQHIYEGDFIDVALLYELWIMIFNYSFCIFNPHGRQRLCEVGDRHCLNAKDIIRVKDCLEVLGCQEGALWELIEGTALRVVVGRLSLDVFQTINNIELGIGWAGVQDICQDFL